MSLKYAVLGFLEESPHYGYEIKQKFERLMGELWPVSYGQLYPTLKKLSKENYVTMKTEQGQKAIAKNVYSITPSGKKAFREWLEKEKKRVQHSIKDEFTLSFFFFDKLDKDEILALLYNKVRETEEYYDKYVNEYRSYGEDVPAYKKMLMKKMLLHLDAEKHWLDETIGKYES